MARELTRRQRQVIELIAAGRTNPEIAGALGITLAGAKWHVSEVLARLGVASREEAADAWRARNQLSERFARPFRALAAGLAWKASSVVAWKVACVAAVALAGGVLAVAAFALRSGPEAPAAPASAGATSGMTRDEASEYASYAAGEYLRSTDIPKRTTVNGHPLSIADMTLVELVFTPAGQVISSYYNSIYPAPQEEAVWTATFRREDVPMPDMGWTDGFVSVSVTFRDASGRVSSASAGGGSKSKEVLPAPPVTLPDLPHLNRDGPFTEVLRLADAGIVLSTFRTVGGSWGWTRTVGEGGGGETTYLSGPTAESPHLFAVGFGGGGFTDNKLLPLFVSAVTTSDVAFVRLLFADTAETFVVEPVTFPAETGLDWKAFAFVPDESAGQLLAAVALDAGGAELSRYEPPLRTIEVPAWAVAPLAPIDFAGTGNATGGAFELPPPAFPPVIALVIEHDAPMDAFIVCDTGRNQVVSSSPDGLPAVQVDDGNVRRVTLSPGATACSFEVITTGSWSFRTP